MTEQKVESPYPLVQEVKSYSRSDEESVISDQTSKEITNKKTKRMKCLLYIVVFVVFQTGIILLFALTVMKIRNPKFRVQSGSFPTKFNIETDVSPSLNMQMTTQFIVKNTNFGHFKYEMGSIMFSYRGEPVGQTTIRKGRARARSTKKVDITVDLNSANVSNPNQFLRSDISSGVIPLTSYSKLHGKIHLMKVIKKRKSTEMNCTMEVVIATKTLQNITCK